MKYLAVKFQYATSDEFPFMICDNLLSALNACRIDMCREDSIFNGRKFVELSDGSYRMMIDRDYFYHVMPVPENQFMCVKFDEQRRVMTITPHNSAANASKDLWDHWLTDIDMTGIVIDANTSGGKYPAL